VSTISVNKNGRCQPEIALMSGRVMPFVSGGTLDERSQRAVGRSFAFSVFAAAASDQASTFRSRCPGDAIFRQAVPTGKGRANATSDPYGTLFTTRRRLARILDLRPTSVRSETTQYSGDRDSFD
jgi:uncharacterized protein involved in propanediol utilization